MEVNAKYDELRYWEQNAIKGETWSPCSHSLSVSFLPSFHSSGGWPWTHSASSSSPSRWPVSSSSSGSFIKAARGCPRTSALASWASATSRRWNGTQGEPQTALCPLRLSRDAQKPSCEGPNPSASSAPPHPGVELLQGWFGGLWVKLRACEAEGWSWCWRWSGSKNALPDKSAHIFPVTLLSDSPGGWTSLLFCFCSFALQAACNIMSDKAPLFTKMNDVCVAFGTI